MHVFSRPAKHISFCNFNYWIKVKIEGFICFAKMVQPDGPLFLLTPDRYSIKCSGDVLDLNWLVSWFGVSSEMSIVTGGCIIVVLLSSNILENAPTCRKEPRVDFFLFWPKTFSPTGMARLELELVVVVVVVGQVMCHFFPCLNAGRQNLRVIHFHVVQYLIQWCKRPWSKFAAL